MMDIEKDSQEQEQQFQLEIEPLEHRNQKKLKLNSQAEEIAKDITRKIAKNSELGRAIDPKNEAERYSLVLKARSLGDFQHLMNKNRQADTRKEIFDVVGELFESRQRYVLSKVKDKLERQAMVVRFVSKEEALGVMSIQDESGREKILIKSGIVWVGMICVIEAVWSDNMYRLQRIFDLSQPTNGLKGNCKTPFSAYRIMFVKGSFWSHDSKQNIGLKVLLSQLEYMRDKEKLRPDCLVVMGPILSVHNQFVKSGHLENTFQEQFDQLVQTLKQKTNKVFSNLDLIVLPSTQDVTNYFPIPQQKYQTQYHVEGMHYTSNPGYLELQGSRQKYRIDLINSDVLRYIDESKTGRPTIQLMQENLQTYVKQPFFMSNTLQEPFDEVNLRQLYNGGHFGDIIVTSSQYSPPYARDVKGRVFVNIGSLGIDYHQSEKHFVTLVSLFDGEGPAAGRVKVDSYTM